MSLNSFKNDVLKNLKAKISGRRPVFRPSAKWLFPSLSQWRQLFKVLTSKEKKQLAVFLLLFFGSAVFLTIDFYYDHTAVIPAKGGEFIEGVVGQPRFINPIYGVLSDVDRDLTQLLFSGLMDYDENGRLVPDIIESYKVLENGKVFEFYLKDNLFWSDGEKLTADDVLFTIKTVQDPDYKSPLRANWLGVRLEKISDRGIRFRLENPYAAFLENTTLKVLPRHIWQNISSENFLLSPFNLLPVSSGRYQLEKLDQDKSGYIRSLTLLINPEYYRRSPNIAKITFRFFKNEEELVRAGRKKEIQGLSVSAPEDKNTLKKNGFNDYQLSLPRYFAIFFNPIKSNPLAIPEVRKALNYGTNRKEIIGLALQNEARVADSPILPEVYGFLSPLNPYEFSPETAKDILQKAGFVEKGAVREKTIKEETTFQFKSDLKLASRGTEVKALQECLLNPRAGGEDIYPNGEVTGFFGPETKKAVIKFQEKYGQEILAPQGLKQGTGLVGKSTRLKLNELCSKSPAQILALSFSLTTVDQPLLIEVANIIKNQWQALGVNLEIKTVASQTVERDIIKPRNYEALLFGEVLGAIPDPFPFWHSSQKKDPGLNLALFENKKADKLLEGAREAVSQKSREELLEEFQDVLLESAPAVFLYRPDYIYLAANEVRGINIKMITDPSKRFSGIENWYLKTARKWK